MANPASLIEKARRTLEAALSTATPAGKRAIRKLLDNSNSLLDMSEDALVRLANGEVPDSIKAGLVAGTGGAAVMAGAQLGRPGSAPESRTEGAPETEIEIEPQAQSPRKNKTNGQESPLQTLLNAGFDPEQAAQILSGEPHIVKNASVGMPPKRQAGVNPAPQAQAPRGSEPRRSFPPQEERTPITYDRFGNPVYYEDPTPEPEGGWSSRPAAAGFGDYAADYDQQLGTRQHATFKILVDAGIPAERAAGIVRGQISMNQMERDAVVANTGAQRATAAGGMAARRQNRMYPQAPRQQTADPDFGQKPDTQTSENARPSAEAEAFTEEDARRELENQRKQINERLGPIDLGDMDSERQGRDETDVEYSQRMTRTNAMRRELRHIQNGGVPPSFTTGYVPSPESLLPDGVFQNERGGAPRVKPSADTGWYSYAVEGEHFNDGGPGTLVRPKSVNTAEWRDFVMQDGPMSRHHRRHDPEGSSAYYDQVIAPILSAKAQAGLQKQRAKEAEEKATELTPDQWGGPADNLLDAKRERAALERRVLNFARQNRIGYQQALEMLSQEEGSPFTALQKTLPGDGLTTIERTSGRERIRRADREREEREKEARLALSATRGMNRTQAARYLEAKRVLEDPTSPLELRRAAGYFLAPQMAQVDAEAAKNGGGDAGDAAIQKQILQLQLDEKIKKGREYARVAVGEPIVDKNSPPRRKGMLWSSPVATQEEWIRLKRLALGDFAPGSPEYNGALEWFHERYGDEFVPPS